MKELPKLAAMLLLMLAVVTSQGANLSLATASNSGVTATVTPDVAESGIVNIYVAALYKGILFFRGRTTTAWSAYSSGDLPIAATAGLTGKPWTFAVTNFDLSAWPGLDLYIGYGATPSDLNNSNHVVKVYTVPTTTTTRSETSTTSTTIETATSMIGWATGNLTFTGSISPAHPRVGEVVTFSFVKDDPDASVGYVCGQWSYGDPDEGRLEHIPCHQGCKYTPYPGEVFFPEQGHREWTTTWTYRKPGTYAAQFITRSGDPYGCNPYGDDAYLRLDIVVDP